MNENQSPKQSRAVSAQYRNTCPTCHAGPGEPCRTATTGRVTDTHHARIETQHRLEQD